MTKTSALLTSALTSVRELPKLAQQEDLNFLLTNRIPRRLATQFIGWFSKVRSPLVRDLSIGMWQLFADVDLRDAAKEQFDSLHDCFIRELTPGARPVDLDPNVIASPCDAIVGACGTVEGNRLIQAKGFGYTLEDLLVDPAAVAMYRDGQYVTLRLTSSMYHRFHAPYDLVVENVNYISGDTWNTNPIALARVEKLFCKNERAVLTARLAGSGQVLTIVPVASILVASIRLHGLDVLLHLRHKGPNAIPCRLPFAKGQEMGWFELGSTIIVFAPKGFSLCEGRHTGEIIRMGMPLLRSP